MLRQLANASREPDKFGAAVPRLDRWFDSNRATELTELHAKGSSKSAQEESLQKDKVEAQRVLREILEIKKTLAALTDQEPTTPTSSISPEMMSSTSGSVSLRLKDATRKHALSSPSSPRTSKQAKIDRLRERAPEDDPMAPVGLFQPPLTVCLAAD